MRSAMLIFALAFIGLLVFGCVNSGKEQNETDHKAQVLADLQMKYPEVAERCSNLTDWELAGCVAEIAKEKNDWQQCMSLPMLNMEPGVCECLTQFSMKANDTSLCEKCSMPKEKGYCRAMVTGDWTECQRIVCDFSCSYESEQTQKDLCLQWVAINKYDSTICSQIQNEQYRDQCLNITTKPRHP